ncbi:MAG: glycosyltransferase family 2 protein [Clostridiales bacterium]|nr:glycosyltransferase family 2 protein [Clostridiales bacterium]
MDYNYHYYVQLYTPFCPVSAEKETIVTVFNNNFRGSRLYIVVPCYNEEAALPETSRRLRDKMHDLIEQGKVSEDSRIMLVNDGSSDRSWELICKLHEADPLFCGVCLSRNRGHQNALLAGLMTAKDRADFTISMDADLQDDVDAVDRMIEEYYAGCEIVYGVRSAREKDSFFKRFTAEGFYKLVSRLGGEIVYNHADYRLMSKTALEALSQYGEVNLFLRGIVPMLGYKTSTVEYERGERIAGESKYPLKKMLSLATDGITSLSSKPIRFFLWSGAASIFTDLVLLIVFIVQACTGTAFDGWKTVLLVVLLMGGLTLTGIGVVGEYVGKIYLETKQRPKYFIENIVE